MADTYLHGFELDLGRESCNSGFDPNMVRLTRTNSLAFSSGTIQQLRLSRGELPLPVAGGQRTRLLTGRIKGIDNVWRSFRAEPGTTWACVEEAKAVSATQVIRRAGVDVYYEAGRNAGGDVLTLDGALLDAVRGQNSGTLGQSFMDAWQGPGYADSNTGLAPSETSQNNGGLWTSHLGFCDFALDDVADPSAALFQRIRMAGVSSKLPNGVTVNGCAFAAIGNDAWIYPVDSDFGGSGQFAITNTVDQNTADQLRNHPTAFVRPKGAAALRSVLLRYRDPYKINQIYSGQPCGIRTQGQPVTQSKWALFIDGKPTVVTIKHPASTDYRRPVDIWNNVLLALIEGSQSDQKAIQVVDLQNRIVGNLTRLPYVEFARYLNIDVANGYQINAGPPA